MKKLKYEVILSYPAEKMNGKFKWCVNLIGKLT